MAADEGSRKLTAILAADVAGYSRLMVDDERATVRTLTEYRTIFTEKVEAHEGRIVDTTGDSVMATFESVVEAVEAAVDVQRDLAERNETLSGHRKMHFRIGVNLGDIIVRNDGTIYGDGVNVAARLEGLAEPGGVMIGDFARLGVEGKLGVGLEDAGEHEVKNIEKPVRAWRVLVDGAEASSAKLGSPSKPLRRPKVIASLAAALAVVIGLAVWGVTVRVVVPQMVTADGTPTDDPMLAMPSGPAIAVLPFDNLESVRRLYVGLQSFRSMSRMDASLMKASALRLRFSQSLASRRQRLSQAMVRSTTQRLGWTTKPFTRSDRLTISVSRSGRMPARAR